MKINCWEHFKCRQKNCPAFKKEQETCWLVNKTYCKKKIQGEFLEKIEECLKCPVFYNNFSQDQSRKTFHYIRSRFKAYGGEIKKQNKINEKLGLELTLGLSEFLDVLSKLSIGDYQSRVTGKSSHPIMHKIGAAINNLAETAEKTYLNSHEFAIGISELFEVLQRFSNGELSVRTNGKYNREILIKLNGIVNKTLEDVSLLLEKEHGSLAVEKSRVEQLEKFQQFAINRELRMVELKKKIKSLEKELLSVKKKN